MGKFPWNNNNNNNPLCLLFRNLKSWPLKMSRLSRCVFRLMQLGSRIASNFPLIAVFSASLLRNARYPLMPSLSAIRRSFANIFKNFYPPRLKDTSFHHYHVMRILQSSSILSRRANGQQRWPFRPLNCLQFPRSNLRSMEYGKLVRDFIRYERGNIV